jgi:hypothetical protein
MDTWGSYVGTWITVLIRIGAVVMVLGLSWNLKDIIIDSAIGSTSAQHYAALIYRIIGIVLAFVLLVAAPTIVRTFQDGLRTPLVHAP